jgi:hypothetical protein
MGCVLFQILEQGVYFLSPPAIKKTSRLLAVGFSIFTMSNPLREVSTLSKVYSFGQLLVWSLPTNHAVYAASLRNIQKQDLMIAKPHL